MPLHSLTPTHPARLSGNGPSTPSARTALAALHDASDPCDLLVSLCRVTRAFGARASACAHVVPDPERAPRLLLLLACEPERIYPHAQPGSALDHAWLRYARDHDEPIWSTQMPSSTAYGLEPPVLLVPTHSGGATGRYGLLMLELAPSADDELASEQRVLAEGLAHELHAWWMRRTREDLQRDARLRSSDLQLLAFERQGLATKQIARLIDSTLLAVDSRFQRINAKLGVANRRHAALRAAIHGLL